MSETWNRKTRRKMSRYGIGQKAMNDGFMELTHQVEESVSRQAFAGMMLALVQEFDFPPDQLRRLAIETMRNINGALSATELVQECIEVTGYDVDDPLELEELGE